MVDYVYDSTNRLLSESISEPGKDDRVLTYTYDKVGNRLTKAENGFTTTYEYDANNRLRKEDDVTYSYDNNGNLIAKQSAEEQIVYQYDYDNRLTRVETSRYGATIVVTYDYDAEGNRVRKVIDETVFINYLVDTNRDYAQVVEERNEHGDLLVRFVYGHDLISQTRDSVTSYYRYDGLGSTRALSSSAGIVTDEYTYDAFGNLLDKSGVTVNTYLYTGEFFDSNIGFYYLRARYMNPQVGRFVTMDTFAGFQCDPYSLHKFLYANANPVNMIDPSGHMSTMTEVAVAGGIIGAMSGIYVYHVTHAPEERTVTGYVTWAAGGSMIGALLAHGSWVLWVGSAETVATTFASSGNDFITFYHGTTRQAAQTIRANGIDLSRQRPDSDFGRGFYVTTELQQAQEWARHKAGSAFAEVLEFKVPAASFYSLKGLNFFRSISTSFLRFVHYFRSGGSHMHSYDHVTGPLLGNPDYFLWANTAEVFGQQTSFHTQRAIDMLYKGLQ